MKIASCMAYLRKDDESTSFGMLDALLLKTDVLKTAGKIKKARAYEKLFDFVRNYDLKQFEYSTNEACFQSRYLKPHVMGAIIIDPEDNGDLSLLSIWVDQGYRRRGIATLLLKKTISGAF